MAQFKIIGTTGPQHRVGYDASNYADFTVSSAGDLTIAPTGGDTSITGTLAVSSTLAVTGAVTGGTYNGQTVSSSASFTGTVATVGTVTIAGGSGDSLAAGSLSVAKDIGIVVGQGIVSNGTRVVAFAGNSITVAGIVVAAASTTSLASFRAPHGSAPTTPTDGDIWTTSSGLFVRINGVTKTVSLT